LRAIPENLSPIGAGFLPRLGAPATGHRQGLCLKKPSPPSVRVFSWARFQKIFRLSVPVFSCRTSAHPQQVTVKGFI